MIRYILLPVLFLPIILHAGETPLDKFRESLATGTQPLRIVCFGDSITGVYYHTGGRRAYPEMLEVALKKLHPMANVQVINAGVSGHTTVNALARIDKDVLSHKPHLVTVMFGMNDMTRVPLDQFKKNLEEIVRRCQKVGAEVVLCTQNNVIENAGRPNKKLAEFTQAIRAVAKDLNFAVADCHAAYEKRKADNSTDWRLLMSDEIHPNMAGHKLLAEVLAMTITGKVVSLADIGPPAPAIPRTLALLKKNQPIKVLAMPPFDELIGPALSELDPKAKVEVTPWPTKGKSLVQLKAEAKKVRGMEVDLVILAVPLEADAPNLEARIDAHSWIMNYSLSFGQQEWDVIAAPPSTVRPRLNKAEAKLDLLARRLIAAQDLGMMRREAGEEEADVRQILSRWLRGQRKRD